LLCILTRKEAVVVYLKMVARNSPEYITDNNDIILLEQAVPQ
jgi:hypothetical protein